MKQQPYSRAYLYKRIVDAKIFIDNHYTEPIDLNKIAHEACFSKYHFLRLFKASYGTTPYRYLTQLRVEAAKKRLSNSGASISTICFDLNFESIASFSKLFKKHIGITPSTFLKQQQNQYERIKEVPLTFIPNCFAIHFGWTK